MQLSQMNFKSPVICVVFFCHCVTAQAQVTNYKQQMRLLHQSIRQHFFIDSTGFYKETAVPEKDGRPVSFLWPLCALFQAHNEMEKLPDENHLLQPDFSIIQKYHNNLPPAPGYASYAMALGGGSRFYDDNQWIGITAMDAYQRTKKEQWLQTGKEIYRFMMTGYDTITGGGLYWQEDNKKSKNTCSNGPGIILALQLYQATKQQSYLDTALLLFNWVNANLQAPSGLYYDNINTANRAIGKKEYSYNTGTMLQAAVYLFECTGDKKYLQQANAIADSSTAFFLANQTFKDDYWFSAVLLRGYLHLFQHSHNTKNLQAFRACLDAALQQNKNENGLMGKQHPLNLVAQGGMLEMLARFALLQQHKIL
jgi:mannose/cellobiose epimerase-like protein (N-acyl-D-glucosamine 2-epimerase family)